MRPTTTLLTALLSLGALVAGCSDVGQSEENHRANESVHAFECVTQRPMADGAKHEIRFSVVGLSARDFDEDFVWPDEDDGDCSGCPVDVSPADSDLTALNENAVVMREDGKLVLEGDADGFYWVTLALYENSGYTKGYVRIEDGGGYVEERYSEVTCTVTDVTAASATDISSIVGFYNNGDHEYETSGPLMVALYGGSDALPVGYDGFVDLALWDADLEDTKLTRGWFKVEENAGAYALEVVAEDGSALGAWTIEDRHLAIDDVRLYHLNMLSRDRYIEQCYGMQIVEYEFEEGFTTYEYPGVDVSLDENGNYEVGFGATSFDASEADITVGEDENGDFEATVKTEWSTYVLRIPDESPRRGQVLFGDADGGDLQLMAHVGCYE